AVALEAVELVALTFPRGDDEGLRIARVHDDIDDAGLVVDVVNSLPGLAAVSRLEEAAFLIGAIEPAERADINSVGILRMNYDAADLEALGEPLVLPRFAAVGGAIDAVAIGDGVARIGFAGADPDDVPIGRRDGDGADGYGVFLVELMLKGG